MYLQQHHTQQQQQQQQQQQWALGQQQNHQLQEQHHQQIQNPAQNNNNPFGSQSSLKRGPESDENTNFKKRNLGSDVSSTQGPYPEVLPDSPGSIRSNISTELGAYQGGDEYFDQSHFSASSSTGASPDGMDYLGSTGLGGGTSAPSTPAGIHIASSSSVSLPLGVMTSSSPNGWNSFAHESHSSPPTPHISAMPNSSGPNGMTATMNSTSLFASALKEGVPLEYRMLQEQNRSHETQMQEQQRLQMTQQQEMQRRQEDQSRAADLANQNSTNVHDDGSSGRFYGYLGGNGRGYTAAMAAAYRDTYGGRNGGMDMDF
ncbi:hypothetical protein BGZ80_004932 [Entomortierella chlamydospora]|uniref:Uncharacterized protein n=1 Tax=Entomortierella chlamydospora TaxID=101097 RepID=A0A9P6MLY7_9FUNG|nr:hypothetical protein BGZ79_002370 [Entomortierella chlamydospora]KAG0007212.1 hypothetical protein BGZ80_004932 [Entomortierella chlamydospora]